MHCATNSDDSLPLQGYSDVTEISYSLTVLLKMLLKHCCLAFSGFKPIGLTETETKKKYFPRLDFYFVWKDYQVAFVL